MKMFAFVLVGGPDRIRTDDPHNANVVRSQGGKFSAHGPQCMVWWKCYQTMRVKMAEEQKNLRQKQKMWALRKPILDTHIFALQEKIQKLELEIDRIVIEKIICQI